MKTVGWLAPDPYRTDRLAPALAGPILLVHGTDDRLIGVHHGRELARLLGERARWVELAGREHNDVWENGRAAAEIRRFINSAP